MNLTVPFDKDCAVNVSEWFWLARLGSIDDLLAVLGIDLPSARQDLTDYKRHENVW